MTRPFVLACPVAILLLFGCGGTSGADAGGGATDAAGSDDVGTDAASSVDAALDDTSSPSDVGAPDVGPHDAGPTDQCTNTADMAIATMSSTADTVASCGTSTLGAEPGLQDCIVSMTGLSTGCSACYDTEVHCVIAHCLSAGCAASPMGAACTTCRTSMCHPAFASCSGLP